jgi:hypothetical protein
MTPPSEALIEAVAREVCKRRGGDPDGKLLTWNNEVIDPHWKYYERDARHFISAHTKALADAGLIVVHDWQPIETAAKTGEARLLACGQGYVTFGFYGEQGVQGGEKTWRDGHRGWRPIKPTHWRPYPNPPLDENGEFYSAAALRQPAEGKT